MRRKKWKRTLAMVAGMILLIGAVVTGFVRKEPAWYRDVHRADSLQRHAASEECEKRFYALMNSVANRDATFTEEFPCEELNSYLQDGFQTSVGGDSNLPDKFHDPRLDCRDGKLRLGVRYGCGFWGTIVSLELRPWLVADEVNLIAVELTGMHAGGIPLSPGLLLESIAEAASRSNASVTWHRVRGNPVALIRLQKDQARPSIQLQQLEIKDGKIVLTGRCTEPATKASSSSYRGK